ncbi:MAG TPA: Gfo/Idh/MocA family oxidoreductase [Gaiellaceae bacterium]|nr:Gfo/Idh/MocA family oxidoreductase [Gaiellaceae bacterium]
MKEIGIGLLGVGWMGEVHSTSYRRVPIHFPDSAGRARLVIAADEVEERAGAAAEKLGYESSTTNWRDVIAHPEVDAVSICAPNFMHREMAVAAAEAGKHFWGEKPLGALPEDTVAIERAVDAAGVRTIVGLNYRNPPAVQYAQQLIADGELGDVNHFRMQFVASYSANPRGALSWRFSRELSGHGILSDLGSHAIDLAMFLCGPIVRTTATSAILIPERPKVQMGSGTHFSVVEGDVELGPVENEDWCAALVEFESGLKGTIELSRVMVGGDARYWFEVNGTRGALAWNFERMNELEHYRDGGYARELMGPAHPDFARFQPGTGIPMGYDDLKVIEAYRFLQSIADGQQREPGVREIAATARVLDAIARSFQSGAWEDVRDL